MRKIIHVDMDAFYASVEQRDNPALRNRPIVVGGSPDGRGVVAAASYEARKFGIRSAMSARKAKQLCRHLTFVRPRFSHYQEISQKLRRIFREITDVIEPLSLDEAYLDVTENKLKEPSAYRIAVYLRSRIKGQLQLTASAGVAPNKFLAKIASDWEKPNGLVVIPPEKVTQFLEQLPVEKLWGVGPVTARKLKAQGLHTTRELRSLGETELIRRWGKFGRFIYELSNGIDHRPVSALRKAKSRGIERTFATDISDLPTLLTKIEQMSESLSHTLKNRDLKGRTLTLKVRYHDFNTITRSHSFSSPINDESTLRDTAVSLLQSSTKAGEKPVRLLGISMKQFPSSEGDTQLSMENVWNHEAGEDANEKKT